MKDKSILYEVERYCNNYFNPTNDPDSIVRNYPPAFLKLVEEIKKYNAKEHKSSMSSKSVDGVSLTRDINNSWQKIFDRELGIYKRAKFI